MAKASQADMDMAVDLSNALEALASHWGPTMPEKIERLGEGEESERFCLDDHEHCIRVIQYLLRLTRSASLFRVVWGMQVLLDPANAIVDPNADTLEHHPDTVAAKKRCAEFDAVPLPIRSYQLTSGRRSIAQHIDRCGQIEGPDKWAVRRGSECLSRSGEWEWEPLPSSRDDDFLARCRFDTAAEAYAAWKATQPTEAVSP